MEVTTISAQQLTRFFIQGGLPFQSQVSNAWEILMSVKSLAKMLVNILHLKFCSFAKSFSLNGFLSAVKDLLLLRTGKNQRKLNRAIEYNDILACPRLTQNAEQNWDSNIKFSISLPSYKESDIWCKERNRKTIRNCTALGLDSWEKRDTRISWMSFNPFKLHLWSSTLQNPSLTFRLFNCTVQKEHSKKYYILANCPHKALGNLPSRSEVFPLL